MKRVTKSEATLEERVAFLERQVEWLKKIGAKKYLTPKEVSVVFSIPTGTLANLRSRKQGPAYNRVGTKVLYRACDVDEWVRQGLSQTCW